MRVPTLSSPLLTASVCVNMVYLFTNGQASVLDTSSFALSPLRIFEKSGVYYGSRIDSLDYLSIDSVETTLKLFTTLQSDHLYNIHTSSLVTSKQDIEYILENNSEDIFVRPLSFMDLGYFYFNLSPIGLQYRKLSGTYYCKSSNSNYIDNSYGKVAHEFCSDINGADKTEMCTQVLTKRTWRFPLIISPNQVRFPLNNITCSFDKRPAIKILSILDYLQDVIIVYLNTVDFNITSFRLITNLGNTECDIINIEEDWSPLSLSELTKTLDDYAISSGIYISLRIFIDLMVTSIINKIQYIPKQSYRLILSIIEFKSELNYNEMVHSINLPTDLSVIYQDICVILTNLKIQLKWYQLLQDFIHNLFKLNFNTDIGYNKVINFMSFPTDISKRESTSKPGPILTLVIKTTELVLDKFDSLDSRDSVIFRNIISLYYTFLHSLTYVILMNLWDNIIITVIFILSSRIRVHVSDYVHSHYVVDDVYDRLLILIINFTRFLTSLIVRVLLECLYVNVYIDDYRHSIIYYLHLTREYSSSLSSKLCLLITYYYYICRFKIFDVLLILEYYIHHGTNMSSEEITTLQIKRVEENTLSSVENFKLSKYYQLTLQSLKVKMTGYFPEELTHLISIVGVKDDQFVMELERSIYNLFANGFHNNPPCYLNLFSSFSDMVTPTKEARSIIESMISNKLNYDNLKRIEYIIYSAESYTICHIRLNTEILRTGTDEELASKIAKELLLIDRVIPNVRFGMDLEENDVNRISDWNEEVLNEIGKARTSKSFDPLDEFSDRAGKIVMPRDYRRAMGLSKATSVASTENSNVKHLNKGKEKKVTSIGSPKLTLQSDVLSNISERKTISGTHSDSDDLSHLMTKLPVKDRTMKTKRKNYYESGKGRKYNIPNTFTSEVLNIKNELKDRKVESLIYSENTNTNGFCYLNLLTIRDQENARDVLGFAPLLSDFFSYCEDNSLNIISKKFSIKGNFVHVKEDARISETYLEDLRQLSESGSFVIGLRIIDDSMIIELDPTRELLRHYKRFKLIHIASLIICILFTGSLFGIPIFVYIKLLPTSYDIIFRMFRIIRLLFSVKDFTYIFLITGYIYSLTNLFIQFVYTLIIYLILSKILSYLYPTFSKVVKFLLDINFKEDITSSRIMTQPPAYWIKTHTGLLQPRTLEDMFSALFPEGATLDEMRKNFLRSKYVEKGEYIPLNTYDNNDYNMRLNRISRYMGIRNIMEFQVPLTLPFKQNNIRIPDVLTNSEIAGIERIIGKVLVGDKVGIETEHKKNFLLYVTALNFIYNKIPAGSVALDVGSNIAHVPIQGYVINSSIIQSKDGHRASQALRAIRMKRIQGKYPRIDSRNFLSVNVKCSHVIFNFVHDVPYATLFMKCRELGAREVIISMTISSEMLMNRSSDHQGVEQTYNVSEESLSVYFSHSNEAYIHNKLNYFSPIYFDKIQLPNGERYQRTIARQFESILILHYSLTSLTSDETTPTRITSSDCDLFKYVAINITLNTDLRLTGRLVKISQDFYSRIIASYTTQHKSKSFEEKVTDITKSVKLYSTALKNREKEDIHISTEDYDLTYQVVKNILHYQSNNFRGCITFNMNILYQIIYGIFLNNISFYNSFMLRDTVVFQPRSIDVWSETLDLSKVRIIDEGELNDHYMRWLNIKFGREGSLIFWSDLIQKLFVYLLVIIFSAKTDEIIFTLTICCCVYKFYVYLNTSNSSEIELGHEIQTITSDQEKTIKLNRPEISRVNSTIKLEDKLTSKESSKFNKLSDFDIVNQPHLNSSEFSLISSNIYGHDIILNEDMVPTKKSNLGGFVVLGMTTTNILDACFINSDIVNTLVKKCPWYLEGVLNKLESSVSIYVIVNKLLYTNSQVDNIQNNNIILVGDSISELRRVSTRGKMMTTVRQLKNTKQVHCSTLYKFLVYVQSGLKDYGGGQCWRRCLGLSLYNTTKLGKGIDLKQLYKQLLREDVMENDVCVVTDMEAYNLSKYKTNKNILYVDDNNHAYLLNNSFLLNCTWHLNLKSVYDMNLAVDGPLFAKREPTYAIQRLDYYQKLLSNIRVDTIFKRTIREYVEYLREMEIQTLSAFTIYETVYGLEEACADRKLNVFDNVARRFLGDGSSERSSIAWDGTNYVKWNNEQNKYDTSARYVIIHENVIYLREKMFAEVIETNLKTLNNYRWDDIKFHTINGVPGCGKTTTIKTLVKEIVDNNQSFLVLTATKANALEYSTDQISRRRKFRTYDSFFTSDIEISANTLLCDECFMVHSAEIFLAALLCKAKVVIMVGDISQIPFISRVINFSLKHERFVTFSKTEVSITHRIPREHLYLIRPFYPSIRSTNVRDVDPPKVIKLTENYPRIKDMDIIITFTQYEKAVMCECNNSNKVKTIHEIQGNTYDKVMIVRLVKHENTIYDSIPHIIVALSRHRVDVKYLTVEENDTTAMLISKGKIRNKRKEFVDISYIPNAIHWHINEETRTLLARYPRDRYLAEHITVLLDELNSHPVKLIIYEAEQLSVLNHLPENIDITTLQNTLDASYERWDLERKAVLLEEVLLDIPVKINFTLKTFDEVLATKQGALMLPILQTPQPPKYVGDLAMVIEGLKTRNLNPPVLYLARCVTLIDRILDKFFEAFIDEIKFNEQMIQTDYDNNAWLESWIHTRTSAQLNNINKQDPNNVRGSVYNASLKNVFKAKADNTHNVSLGASQVLATQDPLLTLKYAGIAKQFMYRLKASLKEKWIINDALNPDTLSARFNNLLVGLCEVKFLEIDFSKYDKSQELFCLKLFIGLMRRFGIPEWLLDEWEMYHITNVLLFRKEGVSTKVAYQRRSGDIFTFCGNTVVAMLCLAWSYDLNKALGGAFGGDDSLVLYPSSYNLKDETKAIADVFNLVAKIEHFNNSPYFSSRFLVFVVDRWIFIPDPVKGIIKLGRDDIYNYEHAEMYYVSFSDNNKYLRDENFRNALILATYDRYNDVLTIEQCSIIVTFLANLLFKENLFLSLYKDVFPEIQRKLQPNKFSKILKDLTRGFSKLY